MGWFNLLPVGIGLIYHIVGCINCWDNISFTEMVQTAQPYELMNQGTSSNAWNEENAQFLEKVAKIQRVIWILPFAHKGEHKLSM